jgi:H+-transporting ATPase
MSIWLAMTPVPDTDPGTGLSSEAVKERLEEYGYNEVPEKKVSPVTQFLKEFWGITPWMLEATAVLEWIAGKNVEAATIAALVVFNAIVGFLQEERANAAIELLRRELRINARVKRDGKWLLLPARVLVPGDILRLRAGDIVPADARVMEGTIDVDQSALTGESLSVERKGNDSLFSGSVVKRGEATGIITSTGAKTYFGRTIELVQTAKPKLQVEQVVYRVTSVLLVMVAIAVAVGTALSLVQGLPLIEILPLATILLLSAVPVALPTMFTISMALGSLELSKRGVLVTRLDSVEDAATMDVVCVDKTGTITMNRLSVADAIPVTGYGRDDVILYGALSSQEANQDPIDLAFLAAAKEAHIPLDAYSQKSFVPFDPSTRRTQATVEKDGEQLYVSKGAVQVMTALAGTSGDQLHEVDKIVGDLSPRGYRTIAVAKGEEGKSLNLVGIAALYDKPRPDSAALIRELNNLGVSVKMLTGDALPIAKEMAAQVGLKGDIIKSSDLKSTVEQKRDLVSLETTAGFAEIYPEDKYLVVRALQGSGHVVGMTGDGINDAPSLKQAEVGISVSNATDVAKKSSSVVLTSEGLDGIAELVKNGRIIHRRITSWIVNKIIRSFKRVIFIVLALVVTGQYVVSTFQMILLMFLSDYVTLSISTDRTKPSARPETWDVNRLVKLGIYLGLLLIVEAMVLLYGGLSIFKLGEDIERLRTFVFSFLVFSGYFTVLVVRERGHFWVSQPSTPLTLSILINSVITILITTFGIPGVSPIAPVQLLTVLVYSFFTCLLLNDFVKVFLSRRFGIVT